MKKYKCPCCAFYTLSSSDQYSFEVCPVCYWENDFSQYENPSLEGGANAFSLNQAKDNFEKIKVSSQKFINLVRKPTLAEKPSSQEVRE